MTTKSSKNKVIQLRREFHRKSLGQKQSRSVGEIVRSIMLYTEFRNSAIRELPPGFISADQVELEIASSKAFAQALRLKRKERAA